MTVILKFDYRNTRKRAKILVRYEARHDQLSENGNYSQK